MTVWTLCICSGIAQLHQAFVVASASCMSLLSPSVCKPLLRLKLTFTLQRLLSQSHLSLQAYQAWLGFYKGSMKLIRKDAAQLVELANSYSAIMGALLSATPTRLPFTGVPGALLVSDWVISCQAAHAGNR